MYGHANRIVVFLSLIAIAQIAPSSGAVFAGNSCLDLYGIDMAVNFEVMNASNIKAKIRMDNKSSNRYEIAPEFIPWLNSRSFVFLLLSYNKGILFEGAPSNSEQIRVGSFRQKKIHEELSRMGREMLPGMAFAGEVIFKDVLEDGISGGAWGGLLILWKASVLGDNGECVKYGLFKVPRKSQSTPIHPR